MDGDSKMAGVVVNHTVAEQEVYFLIQLTFKTLISLILLQIQTQDNMFQTVNSYRTRFNDTNMYLG